MRLVHLSDLHLDSRRQLAGQIREDTPGINAALSHTATCIRTAVAKALDIGPVDLWLVTGDVTDTATPTQIEERVMVDLIVEMSASALVVVIAGNHDVPGSGSGASSLEALRLRRNVHVVETPEILWLYREDGRVFAQSYASGAPIAALACLPYPRRSEFVALVPEGSREQRYAAASKLLEGTIQQLRLTVESQDPVGVFRVLAYHGTVDGATIGVQPRTLEHDLTVPVGAFAGWDYVACGHIHKMQRMSPRVYYAGSIDRTTHDEAADYKGALDVTVRRDADPVVKPIPTPARRYVSMAPTDAFDGAPGDGVVYRFKGAVTPEAAVELRKRVAVLSDSGVWISTTLTIESEARARDAEATHDERASGVLTRWLDAHPEITDDIAATHGVEAGVARAEIEHLNTTLTGE